MPVSVAMTRRTLELRALCLVAGGAEDLQVRDGVGAAERDRDDVVVLQVEAGAALDAAAAVALEHGQPDRARNRPPPQLGRLAGESGVRALERACRPPLAVAHQGEDVGGLEVVVFPPDAVLERPVGAPLALDQSDRPRSLLARTHRRDRLT